MMIKKGHLNKNHDCVTLTHLYFAAQLFLFCLFPLLSSLVVILHEQINTHENKMSSVGHSSWLGLMPLPEATFDICSKGKYQGLSKYKICSLETLILG